MKKLWMLSALMLAWSAAPAQQAGDIDAIVPLVNPDAPHLVFWFCSAPELTWEQSKPMEDFIRRRLFDRTDIQLLGKQQVSEKLSSQKSLASCRCDDDCLPKIGSSLGAKRVIGAILDSIGGGYRLTLKSFILSQPPKLLNSVVEGHSSLLLANGIDDAIRAIFENEKQHAAVISRTSSATATRTAPAAAKSVTVLSPPAGAKSAPTEKLIARSAATEASKNQIDVEKALAPARPGFLRRHLWSTIAAGAAVASLSAGIALGAMSQKIEDEQHLQYDPGRDATGRRYATVANAMFGVAGGAAAAALLLFFLVEDKPALQISLDVSTESAIVQAALAF